MSTRLVLSCWLMCASLLWGADKAARQYDVAVFDASNALPQNGVRAMAQTLDGFVWIGTDSGLVRLDGYEARAFGRDAVTALDVDAEGALWVLGPSGLKRRVGDAFALVRSDVSAVHGEWAVRRDGMLLRRALGGQFSEVGSLHAEVVRGWAESSNGGVWVATDKGMRHIVSGTVREIGSPDDTIAVVSAGNELWAATRDSVIRIEGESAVRRIEWNEPVQALFADRAGHVWILSASGAVVYSGERRVRNISFAGTRITQVNGAVEGRDGEVWVATDRGVVRIGDEAVVLGTQKGLSSNFVNSVMRDREGNVWAATETGGADLLRPRLLHSVAEGSVVTSVVGDGEGGVWLGTNGDGAQHWRDERLTQSFNASNGLPSDRVLSVAVGEGGELWAGTAAGLARVSGGKVRTYTVADGLSDDVVRSLLFSEVGNLWVGTRQGLDAFRNGVVAESAIAPNKPIGALEADGNGGVWVGTSDEAIQVSGNSHSEVALSGAKLAAVTALHRSANGDLWVGTNGTGLAVWRGGELERVKAEGLPDFVTGIAEDESGGLWVSSRAGLARYSPVSGEVRSFGMAGGTEGGYPTTWRAKDGALWFATVRGAVWVEPREIEQYRPMPIVNIESVTVDDSPVGGAIGPGEHRITFRYAGVTFRNAAEVRYRYKLEGFDKDWVDAGSRREATYTNLPAGPFRFRVTVGGSEASYQLRIEPHIYRRGWFYALCAAVTALLVWLAYRLRLRAVRARYDLVLAERTRIARDMHDSLAQDIVGLSLQLELVARMVASAPQAAMEQVDRARQQVRALMANARSAVFSLRSHEVEDDLPSRLQRMTEQVSASGGMKVSFRLEGTYREVAKEVEDEVYKIAQEAVTNALKHSLGKMVQVTLKYELGSLMLSVADDGRGMGYGEGFGLRGMRERAEKIGGSLEIASAEPTGTRVRLRVKVSGGGA